MWWAREGWDIRADENGCGCPRANSCCISALCMRVARRSACAWGIVLPLVTAKDAHLGFPHRADSKAMTRWSMSTLSAPFQHIAHKRSVECRDLLGGIARLQARFNGARNWIFDKDNERFHGRRDVRELRAASESALKNNLKIHIFLPSESGQLGSRKARC